MTGPLIAILVAATIVVALHFGSRPKPVADTSVWHKWATTLPVRLTNGRLSSPVGQLWRRKTAAGWEYQQDAETEDEWYGNRW